MNEYIQGVFGGALIISLLMLNFNEPVQCEVSQIVAGSRTHIIYGVTK